MCIGTGGKVMVKRLAYLTWLSENKNNGLVKVISGVRRSGKSTLFELFKNELIADGINASQLIHLNFEDLMHYELRDFLKLNAYMMSRIDAEQHYYIFFDEIQNVYQFEEVVNSLNLRENLDIYVTGSNAYFMSSELATLLTGRYLELKILPLSFKEFQSQMPDMSLMEIYQRYVKTAFPYLLKETNQSKQIDYVKSTYNDIVLKDIVARYKITEKDILERLLRFLMSCIGSEISVNKIVNTLKSENIHLANKTVEKYIDAFENGLILYKAPRYDIKGRNLLKRFEKYYVVDMGFREYLLPDAIADDGHILENIVYLELKRRYEHVYVGRSDKYEVDFVALDAKRNPSYFQVAFETATDDVLERELRSLKLINDDYPKMLLTLDTVRKEGNYDGIIKQNVLTWLMDGK